MPRAANWYPPDLASNGVLTKAATANNWSASDAAAAEQWYDNFLQAAWNADGQKKAINVINKNADLLWHVHKDTHPDYETYCNGCFGKPLNHKSVPNPHTPSAAELAAVKTYYDTHWPVPDSIVACHT
jgi:hypothetical protein